MKVTREQLIERAILESIEVLKQVGCTYTVTDPGGKVHTNIVVERRRRRDFSELNITDRLLASSIGEDVFFQAPEGLDPSEIQPAVCGHATRVFGSKNYRSYIDRQRGGVVVMCGRKHGVDLASLLRYKEPKQEKEAA
jgi:hypothetical protein